MNESNHPPKDPSKQPIVNPLLSHHQQQRTIERLNQQWSDPSGAGQQAGPLPTVHEPSLEAVGPSGAELDIAEPADPTDDHAVVGEVSHEVTHQQHPHIDAQVTQPTQHASGKDTTSLQPTAGAIPQGAHQTQPVLKPELVTGTVPTPVSMAPTSKRSSIGALICAGLIILGGAGLAYDHWVKPRLGPGRSAWVDFNHSQPFQPSKTLSYAQGQQLYREALGALDHRDGQAALSSLADLLPAYTHLRPLVMIRMAEAEGLVGEEQPAQEALKAVVHAYSDTFLETIAQYRLGQSYMRQKNTTEAVHAFERVVELSPDSDLALGSAYYIGQQALEDKQYNQALEKWRFYLNGSPSGTFSQAVVSQMEKVPQQLTTTDHGLMGEVYLLNQQWDKALSHLTQAPVKTSWLSKAQAYRMVGDIDGAKKSLLEGLLVEHRPEKAQEGIQKLMAMTPSNEHMAMFEALKEQPLRAGKDFILWTQLNASSGETSAQYGQALLEEFPKSQWAPETSWLFLRSALLADNSEAYLSRAEEHLKLYGSSRSAPRVLFWKAKLLWAQGDQSGATAALKSLVNKYPYQYYAYRAATLLKAQHPQATQWQVRPPAVFPPKKAVLPPVALAEYAQAPALTPLIKEVIRARATQDMQLLLYAMPRQELSTKPLLSWLQSSTDLPTSMRTAEAYIDGLRSKGHRVSDPAVYQLYYPIAYASTIGRYAKQNKLDPVLVMALMRQESFFNAKAVSVSDARGLMQLLPSTAKEVAQWEKLPGFDPAQLSQPEVNIRLGTRYMAHLFERFAGQTPKAVGAYNGGPGAMTRWSTSIQPSFEQDPDLFIESIPYTQSRLYIQEVLSHYWVYHQLWGM